MPRRAGFTIIELLVVISIIALLSVTGLVSYTNFMKNSRDAKRQSDLRLIQSALEEYHSDLFFYPTSTGINNMQNLLSTGGIFHSSTGKGNGTAPATEKIYLRAVPKDSGDTPYCYIAFPAGCNNSTAVSCRSYYLYAKLENPPTGAGSYICNSRTYNFRMTLP